MKYIKFLFVILIFSISCNETETTVIKDDSFDVTSMLAGAQLEANSLIELVKKNELTFNQPNKINNLVNIYTNKDVVLPTTLNQLNLSSRHEQNDDLELIYSEKLNQLVADFITELNGNPSNISNIINNKIQELDARELDDHEKVFALYVIMNKITADAIQTNPELFGIDEAYTSGRVVSNDCAFLIGGGALFGAAAGAAFFGAGGFILGSFVGTAGGPIGTAGGALLGGWGGAEIGAALGAILGAGAGAATGWVLGECGSGGGGAVGNMCTEMDANGFCPEDLGYVQNH